MALNEKGLAPKVYGTFKNGMVYGYLKGSPFTVEDMRDERKSALVAKRLADWHMANLSIETKNTAILFPTIRKWLNKVPTRYRDDAKQADFDRLIDLNNIKSRMAWLEREIEKTSSPVVFCHNDLLSGNILYNEETDAVEFIDFEYGGYNYAAFDIANHFCEFAGFDGDYSLYPKKSFQLDWLETYLESSTVSDLEVLDLFKQVQIFALAAHLFWGVWALVQAEISDIEFDYLEYAKLRFDQFLKSPEQE